MTLLTLGARFGIDFGCGGYVSQELSTCPVIPESVENTPIVVGHWRPKSPTLPYEKALSRLLNGGRVSRLTLRRWTALWSNGDRKT